MDIGSIISIIIGLFAISFAVSIIIRELRLEIEVVKPENFIRKWIKRRSIKAKKEIIIASGNPCVRVMNKSVDDLRKTFELNPELKLKIIVKSKENLIKYSKDLCKLMLEPGILERIEMREMDPELWPVQHYIIIDNKDLLISNVDEDSRSYLVISLLNDKNKAKEFKDQFESLWDKLKTVNLATLDECKEISK
jgi:hypothetical protein